MYGCSELSVMFTRQVAGAALAVSVAMVTTLRQHRVRVFDEGDERRQRKCRPRLHSSMLTA